MARDEDYEDDYDDELHDGEDDDESLSSALTDQMGAAPWYVSSVAIHAVVFLISDAARHVTGATVVVDGGRMAGEFQHHGVASQH